MGRHEIRDLFAAAGLGPHCQPQVRAIEAVHEHRRLAAEQFPLDIRARRAVRRGGERDGLHGAELRLHRAERRIFRAEVVAPLRDAMRLVDRQQRDLGALEELEGVGFEQTLRRDINEPQRAAGNVVDDRPVLLRIVGGVERGGRDAITAQLRDLVAHQRDQRRHHDGEAVAQQRRQLIAQRFAAAGRHHREHIAAIEDGRNDIGLAGTERIEAEGRAKRTLSRGEVRHSVLLSGIVLYLFDSRRQVTGGLQEMLRREMALAWVVRVFARVASLRPAVGSCSA